MVWRLAHVAYTFYYARPGPPFGACVTHILAKSTRRSAYASCQAMPPTPARPPLHKTPEFLPEFLRKPFENASWNRRFTGQAWSNRLQASWAVGLGIVFVAIPSMLPIVDEWMHEDRIRYTTSNLDSTRPDTERIHNLILDRIQEGRAGKEERRALRRAAREAEAAARTQVMSAAE